MEHTFPLENVRQRQRQRQKHKQYRCTEQEIFAAKKAEYVHHQLDGQDPKVAQPNLDRPVHVLHTHKSIG